MIDSLEMVYVMKNATNYRGARMFSIKKMTDIVGVMNHVKKVMVFQQSDIIHQLI